VALTLLEAAVTPEPHKHRDGYSITITKGTSKGYALRRLAKARPDLHARVVAKELSPHRAMIEAGFASKQIIISMNPERAARTLRKHFDQNRLVRLVELLSI
jgi:hypothetical protein